MTAQDVEPMMGLGEALTQAVRIRSALPMSYAEHAVVRLESEYRRQRKSAEEALGMLRRALEKQGAAIEACDNSGLGGGGEVAVLADLVRNILEDRA